MNTNKGMDPMLSSFVGDSIWNTKIIADIDTHIGHFLPLTPIDPVSPAPDSMLSSPDINNSSFSDLASLWSGERKRVASVKIEEDEGFSDVGSSEMDMEDDDLIKENISTVSEDTLLDSGDDEMTTLENNNFITSSETEARRYIEIKFLQIAYVPDSRFNHREKIQYILSLSDCCDYTVDQVMSLDKKSSESARVCAKIVQNIPQRYRWECVRPEQIPCCYTIVADCKKLSSRDKPPRPMNAFMIWAQGARRLINELCPKMQNAAISEALGYCWRQKQDSFKKKFELEKVKLRRFHDYEFPAYKYKPKTKVQKAKEKEELSLSKAKLSKTATKRKKTCDILPKESTGRRGRCGRPKKIKLSSEKDQPKMPKHQNNHHHHHSHHHIQSEEPVKMSPTKPAIKDMLTLKILNDRRSKEMSVTNSPAQDNVQHFLGQLSPAEVGSPHTSDVFEELRDLDSGIMFRGKEIGHHRFPSCSSVYDTPANTPPVDVDENTRLSPVHQLHKTQTSCMPKHTTSASLSPTHQNPVLSRSCKINTTTSSSNNNTTTSSSNNKCLLSPQASMPSLTAILSSGPHIPVRDSRSSIGLVSCSAPIVQRSSESRTVNGRSKSRISSTDVILSCVSEILDFNDSKKYSEQSNVHTRDNNNNNSNNYYDFNNNNSTNNARSSWECFNLENIPGIGLPGLLHPKLAMCGSSKIFDFNDIDMLSTDLNVPLLSDDVMSSYMNTL